ncbi:alpha-L-rhamnosidase-like protein [Kribbella orskensis]|uniref:Alpha-L-rhamnosidase-like protein n=1 Tax=Kribbella orskensis TaxID=2512216 RepID=A0ABY2BF49_9ACTN|nr:MULTISPECIES: hypothetical protein [Kribbella]TCN36905.1 alpha-L-rhamnosidase-like protein [Kribbella sp. VKM Ac-2500]TCO18329.1 alpha-L-rhamnosidase-like protein [Kribbella orskensis]
MPSLAEIFADPPRSFSPVPIWWWSGEPLDPVRLRWQLERFVEGGVYQLVVLNLAPAGSDHGCDADDPPFLSEAWWDLFLGVCSDAEELGVSLWFYDQLGFSGADLQARLVARQPSYAGRRLQRATTTGTGRLVVSCPAGGRPIAAVLEPSDGAPGQPVSVTGDGVECEASLESTLSLFYETDHGFDYLGREACTALLDQVHGEFARRLGDRLGKVVVGSFQDELPSVPTWSASFADEFVSRYGYDLRDRLAALWGSPLPDADQVRRDYHALRATLAEEAFFKPLHEWHEQYGLMVGCDQQDPARAGRPVEGVQLYADYARTHRWFSAPGSDHHGDARIHSSLAHLYDRPRTWIEAFHSTGWGGTLEETFDWLLPWLRTGATLYNPHAVYYTTRAGWWEWAPPSTDWRQPYWRHHKHFADTVAGLCAALSMGRHLCDIAVLFPTATVQADLTMDGPGPDAVRAQEVYRELIGDATWFAPVRGVLDRARLDADVIDDDSLARAEVRVGSDVRLFVADERYAAVVLPAATVLEGAVAERLDEFVAAGGLVVAVGALPARGVAGGDKAVALLRERFARGEAVLVATAAEIPAVLARLPRRVEAEVPTLAREVDGELVVFVTATEWSATRVGDGRAVERGISHDWATVGYDFDPERYLREVSVRVRDVPGAPMLVSPFGGEPRTLAYQVDGDVTEVVVPFDQGPAALVVFAVGNPADAPVIAAEWRDEALEGDWEATLLPTLDNTWGDFAWPASGPGMGEVVVERWALLHRVEGDEQWRSAHATFGPHGLIDGLPIEYSESRGIHKDPIHKHALGPKGHVPEEFLDFGVVAAGRTVCFQAAFALDESLDTTVVVGAPAAKELLLDGVSVPTEDAGGHFGAAAARLSAGRHTVELRLTPEVETPLRANLALVRDTSAYRRPEWIALVEPPPAGTAIRFTTSVVPAGESEVTVTASGSARVIVNGVEVGRQGGFLPYERPTPRVRRYDLAEALRPGENQVTIEVTQPSPILVDGLVVSDHDWVGEVAGVPAKVVRRRQQHRALADLYLNRRAHPLPKASWLDGSSAGENGRAGSGSGVAGAAAGVVEPVTFAVPRTDPQRVEYLRFDLPPGTVRLEFELAGHAVVAVDETEIAAGSGRLVAEVPAGGRVGQLALLTTPGFEAGAALTGPIRAIVGSGRIGLGDWEDHGLSEYSGGVRYRRLLTIPAGERIQLDLGRVRGTAEVLVDGRSAGVRFCAPYVFDLTGSVGSHGSAGEVTVDVEVFGTAAPYLDAVSPTHFVFGGQRTSGLFGPVRLRSLARQQKP